MRRSAILGLKSYNMQRAKANIDVIYGELKK